MQHMLVVVHWQDLPQFELFCYSLQRFWKGPKSLTVVISDKVHVTYNLTVTRVNRSRILSEVKTIVRKYFPFNKLNTQTQIKFGEINEFAVGWTEQQFFKIRESAFSNFKDTIVFDCKDCIVEEIDSSYFKRETKKQYNIELLPTTKKQDNQSLSYWESNLNFIPSNLTPWIWNSNDLKKFIDFIIKKEGDFNNLQFFPGNYEIESFYIFINEIIKNSESKYFNKQPVEIYNIDKNLSHYENFKILKLHRKTLIDDIELINLVGDYLNSKKFPDTLIRKWAKNTMDYHENWKDHDDLNITHWKDRHLPKSWI